MFNRLYKNSSREKGTLRYFREKLNHRNVTRDVKHYEACEQFFLSVGKCFLVEAFLQFFNMDDVTHKPTKNAPVMAADATDEQKKITIMKVLEKFLDKYIFVSEDAEDPPFGSDGICAYSLNLINSFMILTDFRDAVASGNGQHLSVLHKQLLVHFSTTTGFNESQLRCSLTQYKVTSFFLRQNHTNANGHQQLTGMVVKERMLKLTYFRRIEIKT